MKDFWIYNLLRLGILIASVGIVIPAWGLVQNPVPVVPAVIVGFVISGILSYFLLNRQRQKVAVRLENRAHRISTKVGRAGDSDKV